VSARSGVNLAGHLSAPQGLGVAARNTAHLFDELGIPWCAVDVPPPAPTAERAAWPEAHAWDARARAPHAVNLLHLNAPEVLELLWERPRWLELDGRVTACVPFWEFPKLPPAWRDGLECMDVVLAPSLFVERTVRAALPQTPVIHFPQWLSRPAAVVADRPRFGIPAGACVFLAVFDTRSDFARKNPLGALDAFARAFPSDRDGVRLVLRIHNARGARAEPGGPETQLRAAAARDPRVVVVDGPLTRDDVLSLAASCDAYVSLHRAEGFGLGPLEAMSLGRPAVATRWSGNLDYMSDEDSLLVPATETPVRGTGIRAYDPARMGAGQTWGEPDLDAAAHHLRALADDPALPARLGARAARAAEAQMSSARSGGALVMLAALAERRARGEPPSAACVAARARVARRRFGRRARRALVNVLRAAGMGGRA